MLGDYCIGRNNNLNFIRFISALFVIYCHSFPITNNGVDYLGRITNGQIDFGGVAVSVFFFYGGFLVCKSLMRINNGKEYFKNRVLRIIPSLVLVVFLSVFILGPCFTRFSLIEYFTDFRTYKYLLNSAFILVHQLPGVFYYNSYNDTVNGSLWTLPIEFLCYILCYLMYKLKLLETKRIPIVIVFAVVFYILFYKLLTPYPLLRAALRPAFLFLTGICSYVYKDKIPIKKKVAVIMGIICILSVTIGVLNICIFFTFTYCLLFWGFGTKRKLNDFGTKYEISYGIYLVGWPIQQILCDITNNNITQFFNFLIAATISVPLGFIIAIFDRKVNMIIRRSEK